MLIYYEMFDDVNQAIAREKQLKNWGRDKKLILIKKLNPELKEIIFD
jgi:putative endonuclease